MSLPAKLTNVFLSELKAFCDSREDESFYDEFKVFACISETTIKKIKAPSKPREKKSLSVEERCVALKKDSTQCNGKKSIKEPHPEFCSIHKRSAAYGIVPEGQESALDNEIPENSEIEMEVTEVVTPKKSKSKKPKKEIEVVDSDDFA